MNPGAPRVVSPPYDRLSPTPMSTPITGTDANFDAEVLNSDQPVLVDFWATWCGPCRTIAPTIEEIAAEYDGKAKVVKLDVDNNPMTAQKYGIRSIPSLLFFKDGRPVDQMVGVVPKKVLAEKLDALAAQDRLAPRARIDPRGRRCSGGAPARLYPSPMSDSPTPLPDGLDWDAAERRPLVIVGTGPAGFTAALYAARAGLAPLVVQGPAPGGQLTTTTDVENFPGYPDGVMGPELMQDFERQAVRFGAELRWGTVTHVDLSGSPHRLVVDETTPILADAVIVSTGASAKYLGLENEAPAARPRRQRVRDVRRGVLPRRGDRHRGRRRHGHGGGPLPDPVRLGGPPDPPARRVPGVEDHAGPGALEPQGQGPLEHGRDRRPRRRTP